MDRLEEIRRFVKLVDETLLELYEENQQLKESIPKENSKWIAWGKEKDKEIERLRKGLEFYADESIYDVHARDELRNNNIDYAKGNCFRIILNDRGKVAQQALKEE